MNVKISVIIKDPGKKPRHVNISDSLENLQKTVGGYIETVTYADNALILCNEEARIMDLPYNCRIMGVDFYGTIILAGYKRDKLTDYPSSFEATKRMFPELWEVKE